MEDIDRRIVKCSSNLNNCLNYCNGDAEYQLKKDTVIGRNNRKMRLLYLANYSRRPEVRKAHDEK